MVIRHRRHRSVAEGAGLLRNGSRHGGRIHLPRLPLCEPADTNLTAGPKFWSHARPVLDCERLLDCASFPIVYAVCRRRIFTVG